MTSERSGQGEQGDAGPPPDGDDSLSPANGDDALPPRVSGVQRHYREHAPHPGAESDAMAQVRALPITRTILEWVGSGRRVLDLGCHDGDISALIRDAGNVVVGVDLPEMVEAARRRHGLEAVAHDLNRPFPFEDGEFDTVVAASVLDDIPDDRSFLLECRRVLTVGGELIVVVPNEVSLFRRIQALLGGSSRDYAAPTGYHTLHCYTLGGIRTLVEATGFDVVEHAKCPKRFSRIPLRYQVERLLPATFATDLALRAIRREPGGPVPGDHRVAGGGYPRENVPRTQPLSADSPPRGPSLKSMRPASQGSPNR